MDTWRIVIEAWPHSTGNGETADREAVSPKERIFEIRADDYAAAHKAALFLAEGIASHGMVWRAVIRSVAWQKML